jgi:hypothetical protein
MIPIACVGDQGEKRAHVMFPGDISYGAGFFMSSGWTAVVVDHPPAMNFLRPECFQKEVDRDHVTSRPCTSVNIPVSG